MNTAGKTYWVSPLAVLGLETPPLALPLAFDEQGFQVRDTLIATKPIDEVRVIPYLLNRDVYKEWLQGTQKFGRPFHAFAYDWRRDNLENLALFELFFDQIFEQYRTKIQVVAHSMGGLITLPLLNKRYELIHSVFFVGVPFTGGVAFLKDLTVGQTIGFNKKILTAEKLATFPSVYSFFPLESQDCLRDENGEIIPADFFSPADWQKNHWGLFAHSQENSSKKQEFLTIALERARQFKLLNVREPVDYPPIFTVHSTRHATNRYMVRKGTPQKPKWEFIMPDNCDGDGRVNEIDTHPPRGIPYKIVQSRFTHASLLNDPMVINFIREIGA